MKPQDRQSSHLSLVRDGWIPQKLSDIRGMYEQGDRFLIFVPHITQDGSLAIFDKSSIDSTLLTLWKSNRDKLCDRLTQAHKITPDENLWHSSGALPNYETCIEQVQALTHAKTQGYTTLGDCWLIKYCRSGRTSYVPTTELYKRKEPRLILV